MADVKSIAAFRGGENELMEVLRRISGSVAAPWPTSVLVGNAHAGLVVGAQPRRVQTKSHAGPSTTRAGDVEILHPRDGGRGEDG